MRSLPAYHRECCDANCSYSLERTADQQWKLSLNHSEPELFSAVIYALPGKASPLLGAVDHELMRSIQRVPQAGCSVVVLGYKRAAIKHPLNAFGLCVPAIEKRQIIAGSLPVINFQDVPRLSHSHASVYWVVPCNLNSQNWQTINCSRSRSAN